MDKVALLEAGLAVEAEPKPTLPAPPPPPSAPPPALPQALVVEADANGHASVTGELFSAMGTYTRVKGSIHGLHNSRPVYELHGVLLNFLLYHSEDGFWCITSSGFEEVESNDADDLVIVDSEAVSPDKITGTWVSAPNDEGVSEKTYKLGVRVAKRTEMPRDGRRTLASQASFRI